MPITLPEQSAPSTPAAGYVVQYAKSDGLMYSKDDAGTETLMGNLAPTPITNSLSGDVSLNNTGQYFTGPTVAQGSTGTWFVSGTVTFYDTSSANMRIKLWDGTTVIASTNVTAPANNACTASLSGYLASPAGNLRISIQDASNTSGVIAFNQSGNSKDSTITAYRIA